MTTPVLLLIFNRPGTTQRVFEAVRAARPARLYVAADGPRPDRPSDAALCAQTRSILERVDWPCEVHTLLQSENLGCRRAVITAIDWFFSCESEGLILEDDCLPAPDFFRFCDVALARWRDDPRVMHLGGHVLFETPAEQGDVRFTRLVPIWGWATWRRAWQCFDGGTAQLKQLDVLPLRDWYGSQHRHVRRALEKHHREEVNAWDGHWALSVMAKHGYGVLPRVNLISNIGFGDDATHTTVTSHLASLPVGQLPAQLRFPTELRAERAYDQAYLAVMNDPAERFQRLWRRMRNAVGV